MPQWVGYDFGTVNERRPRVCQFSLRTREDNEMGNVPRDGPTAYRFQGKVNLKTITFTCGINSLHIIFAMII